MVDIGRVFCWISMPACNKNNMKQFNTTHMGLTAELGMIQTSILGQNGCVGAAVAPE